MEKQKFIELLAFRCENRIDPDFATIATLETTLVQQTEIEANGRVYPWFLESEWGTASSVIGEERLPLPLDFLAEIEGQVMQVNIDGTWHDLPKKRYDEMVTEYQNEASGPPQAYDISGLYILFAPIPDKAYPIRMRFYRRDVPFDQLAATETNKILTHASDWLLACAGRVIAAEHLHNDKLAQKFQVQKEEAYQRVYAITEAREHSNRIYRMEPK